LRGPVGRKRRFFFSTPDLRHDSSTLIFERGLPFAGRSRNEGLGRIEKSKRRFPAFFCTRFDDRGCSRLSKEGSPRASFALAIGQKPGQRPAKSGAAERSNMRRPFTWRLRPVLLFGSNPRKLRHRSGRRARSCSTSPLSPFSVARLRKTKREEESGAKPREGLRRRCRQMARLLSNTDSGNSRAWFIYGAKPSVAPKGMSR
jgi:hypothetical protein